MSALVAMHGIWTLLLVPVGASLAWRLSGPRFSTVARLVLLGLCFGCVVWMGFLIGTTGQAGDSLPMRILRVFNALIVAIDVPILQAILAALVAAVWPSAWRYQQS